MAYVSRPTGPRVTCPKVTNRRREWIFIIWFDLYLNKDLPKYNAYNATTLCFQIELPIFFYLLIRYHLIYECFFAELQIKPKKIRSNQKSGEAL